MHVGFRGSATYGTQLSAGVYFDFVSIRHKDVSQCTSGRPFMVTPNRSTAVAVETGGVLLDRAVAHFV